MNVSDTYIFPLTYYRFSKGTTLLLHPVERTPILFQGIIDAVEELEAIPDIRIHAQSLLYHLRSKKYIFILSTLSKVLDATECCTKALQSNSLALDNVAGYISGVRDVLIMFRSEDYFFEVFK